MMTPRAEAGAGPRHTAVAKAVPPRSAAPQTFGNTQPSWVAPMTGRRRRRRSSAWPPSSLDPREIGDGPGGFTDLIEEFEPVAANGHLVDIDGDRLEEGIDCGSQIRHRTHGGPKIFACE